MAWGMVRVLIFTAAFVMGVTVVGSGGIFSSAAASQPAVQQMNEEIGTSLVVACNGGNVTVRQLSEGGAVQVECNRKNMVVVRDHRESTEKVPKFHLLRNELQLFLFR
jgi:hypothetical protein